MKLKSQEPDPICLSSPSSLTSSTTKWWSKETTAVVTGANKGIGFAMVKRLAEQGLTVVLTCRDVERGKKAVESLSSEGLLVSFFRLDVSDPSSITAFVSWFETTFAALDILVNNAGVTFNEVNENKVEVEVEVEHAETVMRTNYYGAKLLTQSLLPLFRRSPSKSRILNISSRLGSLTKVRNPRIKSILQDEGLSEEKIDWVVGLFLESVKNGTWRSQGWPRVWTEYAVSKLALNAYARVLAKRHEGEGEGEGGGISVNCYCPGFTQTSMTGGRGTHTADQAAQVGVRLLLLPPQQLLTGRFYVGLAPFVKSNL